MLESVLVRNISAMTSRERHARVTAEDLASRWGIGIATAKATLKATTQLGIRTAVHPLTRRYRTDLIHATSARRLKGRWFTDTLFAKIKSI